MDVSKEGYYKIKAQSYYSGCPSIDSVKITLNKSADCKAISLIEIENRKRCTGSTIEIPFKTVGKFEANTTFTVYGILAESGETIVLGKGTKSPISIIINHPYSSYGVNYYIKSSDNVYSEITDYRNYLTTIQEPFTLINGERLACKESNLTFNFQGQNKQEVSKIQWFKDDKIIERETGFSYLASASGNYKVNYTYQSCQFTTGSIWDFDGEKEFRTNGYPIKIGEIQKPYINVSNYGNNPFTICEGTNTTLFTDSLYRIYDPKLSVSQKWKFNNEYIKDADKKSYVATKQGEYIFEITEGNCKNQSEPFKILINDNKKADIRLIAPISQFKNGENLVCKGTNCYLNVSDFPPQKSDSLQIKKDNELIKQGKIFQWYRNGVLIKSKNSPLLKITESGDYKLRMTDGQCLIYSENFKIKILEVMPTYVSNNENGLTASCESGTVDLYKGYNYQGEFRNIYGQLISISNSSTSWFKNGKVIENLGPNSDYRLTSTESGNYHFKIKSFYTDNSTCEFISDTVKVKIEGKQFEILPYDAYKSIQTCRDTIQINYPYSSNSLRPLNYQWKKDGKPLANANDYNLFVTESGNYSLETIYKGGCKSIGLPMKVNMKELSVSIEENGSRCEDNYFNLYASTNNYYKTATYQWLKDGKVLTNQVSQQLINVKDEGKYLVKAKYKTCEATSKELDFVINKIPTLLTPNDSVRFCPNNSVKINASRGKGFIYEWYQNNNLWVNRNADSVLVNESGKYKVLIQRDNCSVVSKPVTVFEKLILPSAQISAVKNQIYYGDSTTVKINLTGDSPWSLKLSDGKNFKINASPYYFNVNPLKSTTYTINEVKNNCGIGTVQGEAKIEVLILGTEQEENSFLKVYPIPTTSVCNIEVEMDTPEQVKIVITDVLGRNLVEKESITKLRIFHEQVDLANFKDGVYFLNVFVGEKKLVRKIIKN